MAMKNFVTGEVLTESDLDIYCVNTIFARKSSSESVTSSITLQDDDHLSVSVAANSVYEMGCVLRYDGATTADLRLKFVGPSGATLRMSTNMLHATAAGFSDDQTRDIDDLLSNDGQFGCLGTGTTCTVEFKGLLSISSTAGTFKLQWAQWASSGTATRLFIDSYIVLRRVD